MTQVVAVRGVERAGYLEGVFSARSKGRQGRWQGRGGRRQPATAVAGVEKHVQSRQISIRPLSAEAVSSSPAVSSGVSLK